MSARSSRQETLYRFYRIIAGDVGGRPRAVAHASTKQMFSASGEDVEDAIAAVKRTIDEFRGELADKRLRGVPSVDEYQLALLLLRDTLSPLQHHILKRQDIIGNMPLSTETLRQGSDAAEPAVQRAIINLARKISAILEFENESSSDQASDGLSSIIAADKGTVIDLDGVWYARENFVEAVRHLIEQGDRMFPDFGASSRQEREPALEASS